MKLKILLVLLLPPFLSLSPSEAALNLVGTWQNVTVVGLTACTAAALPPAWLGDGSA